MGCCILEKAWTGLLPAALEVLGRLGILVWDFHPLDCFYFVNTELSSTDDANAVVLFRLRSELRLALDCRFLPIDADGVRGAVTLSLPLSVVELKFSLSRKTFMMASVSLYKLISLDLESLKSGVITFWER